MSLYLHLWPEATSPKPALRTMAGDLADASGLPGDIPNLKSHPVSFYATLFGAWIAMRFPTRRSASWGKSMPDEKIEIENINTPGRTERVDRAKYLAMRQALLAVLPMQAPGLKVSDAKQALLPLLPADLFPQGKTAGWWLKAVQLDLEAKGVIERAPVKPVHLYRLERHL